MIRILHLEALGKIGDYTDVMCIFFHQYAPLMMRPFLFLLVCCIYATLYEGTLLCCRAQSVCSLIFTLFWIIIIGMFCHPFIGPSDNDACSGERITVTCVVDSGSTTWLVTPGGDDGVCVYQVSTPNIQDMCGPENTFTSSHTEGSSDIYNSSLSVTLTDDLNGTLVECFDSTVVDGDPTGSFSICIAGKY